MIKKTLIQVWIGLSAIAIWQDSWGWFLLGLASWILAWLMYRREFEGDK